MSEKQTTQPKGKRGGARPGGGRPKGSLDKGNAALREMILMSLQGVGGVEYLERVANSHPAAYMALLGRVLPTTLAGGVDLNIQWPVSGPKIAGS